MVPGIGNARADLAQAIEDLGAMLQNSQALAMKTAEKLLKAGVQEAVQDSSVGAQIDITA
ncbi:MAG: hypothetical protein ABSG21_02125 [Spirochaetia bacterium]|jgi:hypothetical protein